jgi:Domain of unknown function (DUF3883)
MTPGDVILAYQTDLQAAVGLCELTDLIDYIDQDGEPQREMWLRPIERFPQPVKIHQLKGADPVLAGARALRRGWPQTLYATTPQEAAALLAACGAKYRQSARPSSSARRGSTRGGGFGDPRANKRVESAAIAFVRATYEREGWTVTSMEREKLGYDLLVTKASREEHLEVKGTRAADASFIITAGEVRRVRTDPAMRLCVVADALSQSPTLQSWRAGEIERDFVLSPVSYWAKRRRDDDR